MKFDRDLTRSVVEPLVLKLVAERPMYGYEIIKVVNQRPGKPSSGRKGLSTPACTAWRGPGKSGERLSSRGKRPQAQVLHGHAQGTGDPRKQG